MPSTVDDAAANKDLVLRYMRCAQAGDVARMSELLAEDCVRIFPRPGIHAAAATEGRSGVTGNQPHLKLYQPGSLQMEVEHIMAEGPLVAVQFVLRATTAAGEPYENFYFHLFECHDGRITKYWEYNDTLYGARMLRPDVIASLTS